jgi:hypothetical protein
VQVIAEINFQGDIIRSRPVNIAIHGGLPHEEHFSIGPHQVNYAYYDVLNGIGGVTALVGDRYSNPVKPGTIVYFSTEAGVIEGSGTTDDLGRAIATTVSGSPIPNDAVYGAGYFYVYAHTIDENNTNITTDHLVLYSGDPVISITPQNFHIPHGGSVEFEYRIRDINNNPLAPGNRFTVSVETSGSAIATGATFVIMDDVLFGWDTYRFTVSDGDPDELKPAAVSITVSTEGPNGNLSYTINGTGE